MRIGGQEYVRSTGSVMVRALGSQPIPESGYLGIFPVEEGTVDIRSDVLENPVALVGEFVDTQWRTYETFQPEKKGNFITIPIDADRATCMIVICEKDKESAGGRWIERRLRL